MNREDVISMALEAGFPDWWLNPPEASRQKAEAVRMVTEFAKIVAAAERKASAEHYLAVMRKAIEEEREACAELMERQHAWITNTAAANAIRARSNT